MRVTVTLEHRFERTPDGRVWTHTMFPASFWQRYLAVFDRVRIVARTRLVDAVPDDFLRVDDEGIEVVPVPYYVGSAQYLLKVRQVRRTLRQVLDSRDALVLRVSSQLASCLTSTLIRSGRPYAVEVVCDPWNVFAPRAIHHPLRPWLRRHFTRQLREQCRGAVAASYVTREALQSRYPTAPEAFRTHYTSAELPPSAFAAEPRQELPSDARFRVITVASLAVPYKGVDVLIESIARCVQNGVDLELVVVGDGRYRADLQRQAAARGCADRIQFRGQIAAGDAVRAELDAAHLFVLASRQEGTPRAMLEAMARGLPCLGTKIGGIPELLAAEDLVDVNDAAALACRIEDVARDADRWRRMASCQWQRAHEYGEVQQAGRRSAFYQALHSATERWQASSAGKVLAQAATRAITGACN